MKRARALLKKLLHPPKWVLLTLSPIVFAALTYVLLKGKNSMPTYTIYCMSAYCLTIWILPLPRLFRKVKASITRWLTGMAFGRKYVGDLAFRGCISIYQGMMANFLYVMFRIFIGVRYASVWFITIAVYYLLLGIMRLSLVLSCRSRNVKSELRCYRRTAWLLFLLNIGMIVLMVLTDSGYSYPGYVIYLSALYIFYAVILSVVNLVRLRKLGSPVLSAAKILNFVAALMSMLGLQTAMISQFAAEGENFRRIMNAITGGGVWFSVILIAVYMLLHSRKMKEVKSVESRGE